MSEEPHPYKPPPYKPHPLQAPPPCPSLVGGGGETTPVPVNTLCPYGMDTRLRPPATPSNLEGELVSTTITMNGGRWKRLVPRSWGFVILVRGDL